MKKLSLLVVALVSITFYSCNNESEAENYQPTLENQAKSSNVAFAHLDGFSKRVDCVAYKGDCAVAIVQEGGMFSIRLERLAAFDDKLMMSFTSENTGEDDRSSILFNNNVTIPNAVANQLGFSSIIINSGDYIVSYDDNPFGDVILDITSSSLAKNSERLCPPGSVEVWEYQFNSFNFHRPVKNCESGFWFCFVDGSWEFVGCQDSTGTVWPVYDDHIIAQKSEEEDTIDFYFPIDAFVDHANYPTEFEVFSVDDALQFGNQELIIGEYPVEFHPDYLKVSVPTNEI